MPGPLWLWLLVVALLLYVVGTYVFTGGPWTRWLQGASLFCLGCALLLLLYAVLVAVSSGAAFRLTSAIYMAQERPAGVPSNPMDANAVALIGVPVVALTQIAKWARLPDSWAPVLVLIFAAFGVAIWTASYGGFHQADLFNYFVSWITTSVAAAGVYGFTRASASAVTSVTGDGK